MMVVSVKPIKSASPNQITVSLKQLRSNLRAVRASIGENLYCLPVKADAYGCGMLRVAQLAESEGIDYLGVAHFIEALMLGEGGIKMPILHFGAFTKENLDHLSSNNIELSVVSPFHAALLIDFVRANKISVTVHLKIDTGMHRLGISPKDAVQVFQKLHQEPLINIRGIFTHLADSVERNALTIKQIQSFEKIISAIAPHQEILLHIANSGGIENYPELLEKKGMVRPGLLSYGITTSARWKEKVHSFVTVKSQVSQIKEIAPGGGISYGHTFIAKRNMRIASVPFGYGDGYSRALSNRGEVLIRDKRCQVVGLVCMDQFMVDIGDLDISPGEEVVLVGKQSDDAITIEEIARHCETNAYEILCHITKSPRCTVVFDRLC